MVNMWMFTFLSWTGAFTSTPTIVVNLRMFTFWIWFWTFTLAGIVVEFLWWSTVLAIFANTITNFVVECFTSWARLSLWASTCAEILVEYIW